MKSFHICTLNYLIVIAILFGIDSVRAEYPQCGAAVPCHEGETCVLEGYTNGIGLCMKTIVPPGLYCGSNIAASNPPLICTDGYACGNDFCISYPKCTSEVTCRVGDTCVLQNQPLGDQGIGLCQPTVVPPGGYCGPNIAASTPSVFNVPLQCGAGYSCIDNACMVGSKLIAANY